MDGRSGETKERDRVRSDHTSADRLFLANVGLGNVVGGVCDVASRHHGQITSFDLEFRFEFLVMTASLGRCPTSCLCDVRAPFVTTAGCATHGLRVTPVTPDPVVMLRSDDALGHAPDPTVHRAFNQVNQNASEETSIRRFAFAQGRT